MVYKHCCMSHSTGWLSHWGEPMANTSLDQFITSLHDTLGFANNTGSVNLYMAHGGTNFGYTAGALLFTLSAFFLQKRHVHNGRMRLLPLTASLHHAQSCRRQAPDVQC